MEYFRELFIRSGGWGFIMLALEFYLIAVAMALLITVKRTKNKKYIIILLFASLTPLLVGLVGTYVDLGHVDNVVAQNPGAYTTEMIENGKELAWAAAKLGVLMSIPALLTTIITFLVKLYYINSTKKKTQA